MDFIQSKAVAWVEFFKAQAILQVAVGSIFLALMAQIAIPLPFSIIPVTLQTLAVSPLVIALGSKKATYSVITYLGQATLGLPVLASGMANPLWMFTPRAGYLLAFVLASFILGKVLEKTKDRSFLIQYISILFCGDFLIASVGTLGLSFFMELNSALFCGFIPFIPGALAKALVATSAVKPIAWIKNYFS